MRMRQGRLDIEWRIGALKRGSMSASDDLDDDNSGQASSHLMTADTEMCLPVILRQPGKGKAGDQKDRQQW